MICRITLISLNFCIWIFPETGPVLNHGEWSYLAPQTARAQTNWWIQSYQWKTDQLLHIVSSSLKLQSSRLSNNSLCLYSIALWSQFFEPCVKIIARQRAIVGPGEVFGVPETSPNLVITCRITLYQLELSHMDFPSDRTSIPWSGMISSDSTNNPGPNELVNPEKIKKNWP